MARCITMSLGTEVGLAKGIQYFEDRQWTESIGRTGTVLQTVAQKLANALTGQSYLPRNTMSSCFITDAM